MAFSACQVYLRDPERIRTASASIREIERWAATLQPWARDRLVALLRQLAARRPLCASADLDLPAIMAVINVTPDSFSDGGAHLGPEAALGQAARHAADGAGIIDIGGESTRPGALPVTPEEELGRVRPVLERLAGGRDLPGAPLVSIDSRRAAVMGAAIAAGARIINDVSALGDDPQSLALAAGCDAAVVLMHRQGEPSYDDAALDVFDYLEARIAVCAAAGIDRDRLIVDPGIGFGKRGQHNLAILRSLGLFHGLGCPLLLGVSRKGLTGELDRRYGPGERLPSSLAAAVWALNQGVQILRVHDVAETRQAIEVWRLLVGAGED